MKNQQQLTLKIVNLASHILDEHQYVSTIDILLGLGYLSPSILEDWYRGRLSYLENGLQVGSEKLSFAIQFFHQWANQKGLIPRERSYIQKASTSTNYLTFSKNAKNETEQYYKTYYISPMLSDKKQQSLIEKIEKAPEPVVYVVVKDSRCSKCQKEIPRGSFLMIDNSEPFCMTCSPYKDHVYLPAGDALLIRRAKKYSKNFAVVVKFSQARKRYERQGLLITEDALRHASDQS
ncbi:hypothetical protein [Legionella shakespearei]|uniref:Uncharacterized protein n=1 Tax=Legionella shakespearei DSM 23087 TaxID=1122169 RepID=A0A0W0YZR2_9GAMM|nr:hypothetical protein [Legionella shakespearei]KTD62368.1 hypothetical protein Lsha_1068 [Legionella shakespearei DSM 23087]